MLPLRLEMRRWGLTLASLTAVVVAAFISACDDDDATGPGGPRPSAVALVTVVPGEWALSPERTIQLNAEVRDSAGRLLPDEPVTWTSDARAIATVDSTGLLTAVTEGFATIIATAGGVGGTADITVEVQTVCRCTVVFDSTKVSIVERDTLTGDFVFEVLDGEMPELDTASVIVGAQDGGFLRFVDSVEQSGNMLMLETTQAGLGDAVENGSFAGSAEILVDEDSEPSSAPVAGETWWGPTETVYMAPGVTEIAPGRFRLTGKKFILSAGIGPGATSMVFEVKDGALKFGPTLDIGAKMKGFSLDEFHAILRGGLELGGEASDTLQYAVTFLGSFDLLNAKWPIVTKRKPFLFWAGWVPIAGVVEFTLTARAVATTSASVTYQGEVGAGFSLTGGARYDGDRWSPVSGSEAFFHSRPPSLDEPEITVQARLKFSFVPELFIRLYGVAGPFVNVDPHLLAPAQFSIPAFDSSARVEYGTDLNMGLRAELLRSQRKKDQSKKKESNAGKTDEEKKEKEKKDKEKFGQLEASFRIPLHKPFKLAEAFSDGPLKVTNTTTGDDRPFTYEAQLRPAFEVDDALFGRKHTTSTQDTRVAVSGRELPDSLAGLDSTIVFEDVRSGSAHPHKVRLTEVQGNCTVLRPRPDTTVAVASSLRLSVSGDSMTTAPFRVHCIPFGALEVTTATLGPDPDPDGYALLFARVDTVGIAPKYFIEDEDSNTQLTTDTAIAINTTVLLDSLIPVNPPPGNGATGAHRTELLGIRPNCAVAPPVRHISTILSGDTINTHFEVRCIALGHVRVTTAANDPEASPPADPIRYQVDLFYQPGGGAPDSAVATVVDSVTADADVISVVSELIPLYNASGATGRHSVELSEDALPNRCDVSEPQQTVTVLSADTAAMGFEIDCVERLHIMTTTTGPGDDADGYTVVVTPDQDVAGETFARPIGTNQSLGIAGVAPGRHTITLTGITATCNVTPDSFSRDISGSDSTVVSFEIACPAPPPPVDLVARERSESEIELDWSRAPIPDSIVAFYNVYRDGDATPLARPSDTTFTDSGLPAGTRFCYRVSTVNVDGLEGEQSFEDCATTLSSPAVLDSVIFAIDDIFIIAEAGETEASLGSFEIPPHIEARGVEVQVRIRLSGDEQKDEAFALGTIEGAGAVFIGDPDCPVVRDDPNLVGESWVLVGSADLPAAQKEFLARHAIEFECYDAVDSFRTPNSVHFFGIKFVFWREQQ